MKKRFVLIILTFMLFLPSLLYAEQMEVPEDPQARTHFLNGLDLFLGGLYDEAIAEYREVLNIIPNDPYTHNFLAHALKGKGQIDEAINEYREAIKLKPNYAYAHNNLGEALYEKGQIDEAKKEWEATLKMDKMHILARRNLKKLEKEEAQKLKEQKK